MIFHSYVKLPEGVYIYISLYIPLYPNKILGTIQLLGYPHVPLAPRTWTHLDHPTSIIGHVPGLVNVNRKLWKDPPMLFMGKSTIATGPWLQ